MLGHQRPDDLWQVGDLTALGPGDRRAEQPGTAAGAPARLVRDHLVRVIGHLQRRPRLALRPARLAPALPPLRPGRRLGQPLG
jgi:hypothetical protein